jgi:3-hydroxyacyl-[acyl-carrier-protein] dehydratase
MSITMDIREIQEYLPHRYPFLLVDRVLDLVPGVSVVAIKNITYNEPQFTGHFPDNPVFPGVSILEAMAQAAGLLAMKTVGKPAQGAMYYFAGIDNAKFKRVIVPGDQVVMTVSIVKHRRNLWVFEGKAEVDGELAASATLKTASK